MRQHDLAATMGRALALLAAAGVLYSALLVIWVPPGFWWASIAWAAAAGWIVSVASFAICGHPQALRWANLCGLLAGGFTWMPMVEPPTLAPVFRIFLPLALRLALRLPAGPAWIIGTLAAGAAVGPVGSFITDFAFMVPLVLWSIVEFFAGFGRARWAQCFGAVAFVPTGFAAGGGFGLDPFISGAVVFTVALFVMILHASLSAARLALLPRKGIGS